MKGFTKVLAVVCVTAALMYFVGLFISIAFVGGYVWGTK